MTQKLKVTEGVAFAFTIPIIFLLSVAAVAVPAANIMLGPESERCFNDRFVVLMKAEAPRLLVGDVSRGTAVTGVFSIDRLCLDQKVVKVEQWYAYPVQNAQLRQIVERLYVFYIEANEVGQAITEFAVDPNIASADLYRIPELDYTPNDPQRGSQWHLGKIQAYGAWDLIRGDSTRYSIIGIVDTGVYWMHPDLSRNMWINELEDLNHNNILDAGDINGVDNDGDGYVDDVIGWDMADNDYDPQEPSPIHGTHVAGCASEATNNSIGGAGLGWSARLLAVKGGDIDGDLVAVWQGVVYAADRGAQIINCSWGSPGHSSSEQIIINTVYSMGVTVVAAAGNDDFWTPPYFNYPSAYDHVIAVAATNSNDTKASFTNYGSWVDVSAPGSGIYATWSNNTYINLSGTSMSSPMVAALAGLLKAINHTLTVDQITSHIKDYADNIDALNPGFAGLLGTGRINAMASLMPFGFVPGDVNNSGSVEGGDVTYLVRYFKGIGPAPVSPILRADANGDCSVLSADVIYLVSYFKGGETPLRGNCGR